LKTARFLACCLLILPLVGTPPPVLRSRTKILRSLKAYQHLGQPFAEEMRAGSALIAAGRYRQAAERFQVIAATASAANNSDLAASATSNAGACQFALHQYQSALESFLKARRMAESAGNSSKTAALDINIASIYSEMGEVESAARWIENSLANIRGKERRSFLPKLQIQMAVLRADQGDLRDAERLFRQGIEAADAEGDLETYALGCNRMGEAFLLAGDTARAEPPLLEAFRVRKLHHLPLDTSYHRLGRLRLAQGDLTSASNLLDRAVELAAHAHNLMPGWDIYYSRGKVRLEQGRLEEALADLRKAVRLARDWRWSLPAAETARISAESKLDQVYAALIEAAGRLHSETGDPLLAVDSFAAAEENRAASLRNLISAQTPGGQPASLPPAWWEAVTALERAEMAALPETSTDRREAIRSARADLARVEASAGVPPRPGSFAAEVPGDLLMSVRAALQSDSALFSFHLGETDSWLWAVDKGGLVLRRLPPRAEVDRETRIFSRAIRENAAEANRAGERLFAMLFGPLPVRFTRRSRWLLSLDQNLFDVPMAALVERPGNTPVYVAERHVIQVIPGVLPWLESPARQSAGRAFRAEPAPIFLGIGDAIYNAADPRRARPASSRASGIGSPFRLFAASQQASNRGGIPLALPRLVASGPELAACARAWRGGRTLLEGADATRARLIGEVGRYPAVIHFATHFLASAEGEHYLVFDEAAVRRQPDAKEMIALSLNQAGETELVTADEIAHWPVRAELVSLSGCRSAGGAALPGTGLLGLTRAWLSAGARSVVGSLWDTPDESGALFSAVYRHLSAQTAVDPAPALNSAQREMIRAGGWRAQPRYWGAYFVVTHE